MTLDTRVYVHDQVDARELFAHCQSLLAKYDDRPGRPEQQWEDRQDKTWRDGESFVEPGNPRTIANDCGQGLPAWLMIHYRPDAPMRPDADACHEYCDLEPDEDGEQYHYHKPAHWLVVSMDTTYGYRDARGWGCGDLHAVLVSEIGQWLDARGIGWSWENEFTSEVHSGEDKYERLVDLCSGGFEASAWFRTTALPAIAASIAEERAK